MSYIIYSLMEEIEKILNDKEDNFKSRESKIYLGKTNIIQAENDKMFCEFKENNLLNLIKKNVKDNLNEKDGVYSFFLTTNKTNYEIVSKTYKIQNNIFLKELKSFQTSCIKMEDYDKKQQESLFLQYWKDLSIQLKEEYGDEDNIIDLYMENIFNNQEILFFIESFKDSLNEIIKDEKDKKIKEFLMEKLQKLTKAFPSQNKIKSDLQIIYETFLGLKLMSKKVVVFYDISRASLFFLNRYFYLIKLLNNQYDFYIDSISHPRYSTFCSAVLKEKCKDIKLKHFSENKNLAKKLGVNLLTIKG